MQNEEVPSIKVKEKKEEHSLLGKVDVSSVSPKEDFVDLLKKNLEFSEKIYIQNIQIKKRMTLMTVASYLRILLILAPIILGIIYLPALFSKVWDGYQSTLGINQENAPQIQSLLNELPDGGLKNILQFITRT